jgi:hypothetical protein
MANLIHWVKEISMSTFQSLISNLAAILLLLTFVTSVAAVKPDKPGGGGKPPTDQEPPVEVVYVGTGIDIDGYMGEWANFGCNLFPQYWAGKVWKNRVNDGILGRCVETGSKKTKAVPDHKLTGITYLLSYAQDE